MSGPALTLAPDRYTGRKLGKYEIICRLSTGGMAAIFLAFQRGHAGFTKLVVLKQILPDVKAEQELVDMFLDEAKITAAFNHPNIGHVYDLDIASDELFLAMEFVAGADVLEIARACHEAQEPIPIGFTLTMARDTALALHYAHTFIDPLGRPHPVIHRDVAEKNIMVTYEGITKLLDFGIAKAKERKTRTAAGMVKGTLGYMSPEQLRGKELDARTDVYSLGVVLHECLTGMRLFHGDDHEAEITATLETDAPPPSEQNPQIWPELDALVLKALQRDREGRYPTALELARAIERASMGRMFDQEQMGKLVQKYFMARREQTRALIATDLSEMGATVVHRVMEEKPTRPSRPGAVKAVEASDQEDLKAQLAELAQGVSADEVAQLNLTKAIPIRHPTAYMQQASPPAAAPSSRPRSPVVAPPSGPKGVTRGYDRDDDGVSPAHTLVHSDQEPSSKRRWKPVIPREEELEDGPWDLTKPMAPPPNLVRGAAGQEAPFSALKLGLTVFAVVAGAGLLLALILRILGD